MHGQINMADCEADELFAQALQKQFNEEEEKRLRFQEKEDLELALSLAGTHDISDSDESDKPQGSPSPTKYANGSDSDQTVDLCSSPQRNPDHNHIHITDNPASDSDATVDLNDSDNCEDFHGKESEFDIEEQSDHRSYRHTKNVHDFRDTTNSELDEKSVISCGGNSPVSDDSDRTVDPNEENLLADLDERSRHSDLATDSEEDLFFLSSSKYNKCSSKMESSGKNKPYKFKTSSSSLHGISDSESSDDDRLLCGNSKSKKVNESVARNRKLLSNSKISPEKDLKKAKGESLHPVKQINAKISSKHFKESHKLADSKEQTVKVSPTPSHKLHASGSKSPSISVHKKLSGHGSPQGQTGQSHSSPRMKVTLGKRGRRESDASSDTDECNQDEDGARPVCPYGEECYRKNPSHHREYQHAGQRSSKHDTSPLLKKQKTSGHGSVMSGNPYNLFLTKVTGIPAKFNASLAMNIKDILSPSMGNLQASAQFNYMTDISWLMEQYPAVFRDRPLLIVHGMQRENKTDLDVAASKYQNIKLCQARLEMAYGTHHTKMMFLLYDNGMRVVIHTANLVEKDWFQKTQGIWMSPLFPKLAAGGSSRGDSLTYFKQDLLAYVTAYKNNALKGWLQHIQEHDMTDARVYIIGSTPGRYVGDQMKKWGHLKLRKVLQEHGPSSSEVKSWSVTGQFSSIGTLGQSSDKWLTSEWLTSMSATKSATPGLASKAALQLVFPTKDNVRLSLEGYVAGASIPYSIHVARKQQWLNAFFRQWKSERQGRSRASPHIKSYLRASPDSKRMAWFLVTSANLSKAAWGAYEKNGSQLMIRSYELGVLFLPQHFDQETFQIMQNIDRRELTEFPLPYDLPLVQYLQSDRPWIWDIPYKDKPDSHGNMWCPS